MLLLISFIQNERMEIKYVTLRHSFMGIKKTCILFIRRLENHVN